MIIQQRVWVINGPLVFFSVLISRFSPSHSTISSLRVCLSIRVEHYAHFLNISANIFIDSNYSAGIIQSAD